MKFPIDKSCRLMVKQKDLLLGGGEASMEEGEMEERRGTELKINQLTVHMLWRMRPVHLPCSDPSMFPPADSFLLFG